MVPILRESVESKSARGEQLVSRRTISIARRRTFTTLRSRSGQRDDPTRMSDAQRMCRRGEIPPTTRGDRCAVRLKICGRAPWLGRLRDGVGAAIALQRKQRGEVAVGDDGAVG